MYRISPCISSQPNYSTLYNSVGLTSSNINYGVPTVEWQSMITQQSTSLYLVFLLNNHPMCKWFPILTSSASILVDPINWHSMYSAFVLLIPELFASKISIWVLDYNLVNSSSMMQLISCICKKTYISNSIQVTSIIEVNK